MMGCYTFKLVSDSHGLSAETHRVSTVPMSGFQARSDCYVTDLCNIEIVMTKSQLLEACTCNFLASP